VKRAQRYQPFWPKREGVCLASFSIEAAKGFVLRMFDAELGLCRCSPNAEPYNYWIYNDNYLAALLLDGTPTATVIKQAMQPYLSPAPRITLLGGSPSKAVLKANKRVTLKQIGTKTIMTEQPTRGRLSVDEYADIAFYSCIDLCNQERLSQAAKIFTSAEKRFWDGVGFKDKVWIGLYDLYKNALYLIAAKRLRGMVTAKHRGICESRIAESQASTRPEQLGGCLTEYSQTNPTGDTNVETTVLCALAMK